MWKKQEIFPIQNKKGFTIIEMIVVLWLISVWVYIYALYFNVDRWSDLQRVLRFTDFIVTNIATEKVNTLIGRWYYSWTISSFIRPETTSIVMNMAGSGSIEIRYMSSGTEVMLRRYIFPFLDDNKKYEIHWIYLQSASGWTESSVSWVTLSFVGNIYSFTWVIDSSPSLTPPYPQLLRIHVWYKAYRRDIFFDRRTGRIWIANEVNP